jgi:hypothetical protein
MTRPQARTGHGAGQIRQADSTGGRRMKVLTASLIAVPEGRGSQAPSPPE